MTTGRIGTTGSVIIEQDGRSFLKARHLLDLLWLRGSRAAREAAAPDRIRSTAVGFVCDRWRVRSDLPAVLLFGKASGPKVGRLFLSVDDGFPRTLLPKAGSARISGIWCHMQTLDLDDPSIWWGIGEDGLTPQRPEPPLIPRPDENRADRGTGSMRIGPAAVSGEGGFREEDSGAVASMFARRGRRFALTAGHVTTTGKPLLVGRGGTATTCARLRGGDDDETIQDYFRRYGVASRHIPPMDAGRDRRFEVDCALAEIEKPPAPGFPRGPRPPRQRLTDGFWPVGEDVVADGPKTGRQLGRVIGFAAWTRALGTYQDYALIGLPGYRLDACGDSGKPFVTVRDGRPLGLLVGTLHPGRLDGRAGTVRARHLRVRAMGIRRATDLLLEQMVRKAPDQASAPMEPTP